jgi:hypothetical protein
MTFSRSKANDAGAPPMLKNDSNKPCRATNGVTAVVHALLDVQHGVSIYERIWGLSLRSFSLTSDCS